jgi:hypothetical protein
VKKISHSFEDYGYSCIAAKARAARQFRYSIFLVSLFRRSAHLSIVSSDAESRGRPWPFAGISDGDDAGFVWIRIRLDQDSSGSGFVWIKINMRGVGKPGCPEVDRKW